MRVYGDGNVVLGSLTEDFLVFFLDLIEELQSE